MQQNLLASHSPTELTFCVVICPFSCLCLYTQLLYAASKLTITLNSAAAQIPPLDTFTQAKSFWKLPAMFSVIPCHQHRLGGTQRIYKPVRVWWSHEMKHQKTRATCICSLPKPDSCNDITCISLSMSRPPGYCLPFWLTFCTQLSSLPCMLHALLISSS
jgi:hypothetical protein